jgi:MFS family permease
VVLLSSAALTIMSGAAIAPALPDVATHFGVDAQADSRVKLLLTLPAPVIVLTAPLFGWLADHWGRRPVMTLGFMVFGLTGLLGLIVNDLNWLLGTRLVFGLSVAALVTSTNTLLADHFTGDARNRIIGRQSIFMSGGSIVFLLGGGLLASFGWRVPFAVYLIGFPFLVLALAMIPEVPGRLSAGQRDSSSDGLQAPAGLFQPVVVLVLVAAILAMVVFYQIPVQLPFHLRQEFGASPALAGAAISFSTVFSALSAMVFSRVLRRIGHGLIMAIAFSMVGAALGFLAQSRNGLAVGASLALLGCGLGWLMPNLTAWMANAAPAAVRGRAMGVLSSGIFLGQFLAPILAAPVLSARLGYPMLFALTGLLATVLGLAFLAASTTDVVRRGALQ